MKEQLRFLYEKKRNWFEVWNYLWLHTESDNSFHFTYTDLCCRFNVSKSCLHRILKIQEQWNTVKVFSKITKDGKGFIVKFYPLGKKAGTPPPPPETQDQTDRIFEWILEYYVRKEVVYPELKRHKKYIPLLFRKMDRAIQEHSKKKPSKEAIEKTLYAFFEKLPEWWVNNQPTLDALNKHFTKIYNQIKNDSSNKKGEKYADASKRTKDLDYSGIFEGSTIRS